jgi:hypothetical protein
LIVDGKNDYRLVSVKEIRPMTENFVFDYNYQKYVSIDWSLIRCGQVIIYLHLWQKHP